ncbi:hypothetical protein Pcinc_026997 [Petrolisthes cinctipes]|uniref:Reverse transcriptase domain-containing protein n=1 Tax=Petrolisthes cinctipes TaxID=88211 RepID=A0AAE1F5M6_PETCI|nr:hypothetical protein Pcinc_026997 [Petrolisthes cinctipes]
MECWRQHFSGHLNAEFPHDEDALDSIRVQLEVDEGGVNREISHEEVKSAVGYMKLREVARCRRLNGRSVKSRRNTMRGSIVTEIRYADDTTLIVGGVEQLRVVTEELERACRRWGLKINAGKSKTMSPLNEVIAIDNEDLEHVEEFTFMGSVVPGSESDIKRTALAAAAFGRLRRMVSNRRDVSRRLYVRLYKALLIRPIATYASETWIMRVQEERMLLVFEMRYLRARYSE